MKHFSSSGDPATRKKYVEVTEAVQHKGGEVLIFSSMHESGQRKLSCAYLSHAIQALFL
jgi:stalled ribosome rescue protein Dom34